MFKLFLIHIADMTDVYILKHRFNSFCTKVGMSNWWGDYKCFCFYCKKIKSL
jgi:hypothetical protein